MIWLESIKIKYLEPFEFFFVIFFHQFLASCVVCSSCSEEPVWTSQYFKWIHLMWHWSVASNVRQLKSQESKPPLTVYVPSWHKKPSKEAVLCHGFIRALER